MCETPQAARFSVSRAVSPPASQPHAARNRPTPAHSRARRSRAEFQVSSFSDFGGAQVKPREHVGSYRNHHRGDTRENPFHFRHLGIGQFRFGTGSVSGQVRAVLICCTPWVFIMYRAISTAKLESSAASCFGICSDYAPIGTGQK
jgi:hypothetical protein